MVTSDVGTIATAVFFSFQGGLTTRFRVLRVDFQTHAQLPDGGGRRRSGAGRDGSGRSRRAGRGGRGGAATGGPTTPTREQRKGGSARRPTNQK